MPRSGTSLMMQMLNAGGIPALSDGRRLADQHNPHGYFEDERARKLALDSSWIAEARGKAIKIIYRLLPHLPPEHHYSILFMERDLNEVYDSQQDMLESRGDAAAGQDRNLMIPALARDLAAIKDWLTDQPNIRCVTVPYGELISNPQTWAAKIAAFLGVSLDREAMAATVDPALYRHR